MKHTLTFHTVNLGKQIQKAQGYKTFPLSLGYSQAQTLILIYSQKLISQSEIAKKLHIETSSVVKIVNELEKLKLVERLKTNGDLRKFQIKLTPKGISEISGIAQKTQKLEKFLKSKLDTKEVASFMSVSEKINAELKNYNKGGEK